MISCRGIEKFIRIKISKKLTTENIQKLPQEGLTLVEHGTLGIELPRIEKITN